MPTMDGANHYQVLGVERTADERAIKRAYFEKVRQFPPETHPEEFKRIREAYEVLSDPERRREYDGAGQEAFAEYGPEIGARLRKASALEEAGQRDEARAELKSLLEDHPELHLARDLLGLSLLSEERDAEALAQFEQLSHEAPEVAEYHLHRGWVHHRARRLPEAREAYERAKALDPRSRAVRVALADCRAHLHDFEGAIAEIDEALAQTPGGGLNDLGLLLRKVDFNLDRVRWDLAEEVIDRIEGLLPQDAEPELRGYVATRLGSLAAGLFANGRSADANKLLARCRKLNPSSAVDVTYPTRVELELSALPASSQAWLAEQAGKKSELKLEENGWLGPWILQLVAAAGLWGALWYAFGATGRRDAAEVIWAGAVLAAALLLFTFSVRRLLRTVTSAHGCFRFLHALHLLEVKYDRVVVWPLVNLRDVRLVHHRYNGVYTHTVVELAFTGRKLKLNVRGRERSEGWGNLVLRRRHRVLELMNRGLLEAEEGVDLIPAALLEQASGGRRWLPRESGALLRWYGGAAAAAAVLALVSVPVQGGRADDHDWGLATQDGGMSALLQYLASHPAGRHAGAARAAVDRRFEEAQTTLAARTAPDRPGAPALREVLRALKEKASRRVRFTFHEEEVDDAAVAGGTQALKQVHRGSDVTAAALTEAVQEVLGRAVGSRELLILDAGGKGASGFLATEASPVAVALSERIRPTGDFSYASPDGTERLPGLRVDWELTFTFEGEKDARYRFACRSDSPVAELHPAPGATLISLVDEQAHADAEDFLRQWVEGWGLPGALPDTRPRAFAAATSSQSPYER